MARKKYSVGIVGLGFGRAHIPAFQANGCEVVAVCQRNQETARSIAARYNVPGVFERWEQMLDEAKPDIVVIAAPPHLHREIALRALGQGAHVLCEKPLAMTAAEGRDMVEAAVRAQRVAMTCFNWRFIPAMQRFHSMVEEGGVGRLFHAGGRWLGARWADEAAASTWRMDRAQAGHGAMGDMGVHLIDMVRWNFGEFAKVSAQAGVAYASRAVPGGGRPADAEDFCNVLAELASGGQVVLSVSRAARGANEVFLEAYGSQGALVYRIDRERPKWYVGELRAAGASGTLQPVSITAGLPRSAGEGDPIEVTGKATIAPLVKRFFDGIRKGESPSPTLEDGVRAQLVLDAILRSLPDGSWQRVEP
ncbi:MAG TPA: Gfo/Idh/MocA family oxidoreductase [Candidatus Bathyarchaeia archaeon]|nr:Gfo/Idh/MocA family oxidoreductase [Candidatus Bathyarchaeia archaeon]